MLLTVFCLRRDRSELTFSLQVDADFELQNFRALCELESGIPAAESQIVYAERPLTDNHRSLASYGLKDGDVVILQQVENAEVRPPAAFPGLPRIDFSSITVPGTSAQLPQPPPPQQQQQQQQAAPGPQPSPPELPSSPQGLDNPGLLRDMLLANPHELSLLKERNPPLAEALLSGDLEKFTRVLVEQQQDRARREQERIRLFSADPFDLEAQAKIEEDIRQQNIEENMTIAMEEAPESFGQVVMLYINCKVNGHPVKAFVDSGAQMTIMSQACAERCNIMRLVDRRWAGIAKGVGTQKIIGRVHLAQVQIEGDFLPCSFSILEEQPMDMLLGLDMLKRHQCSIDLKKNVLVIGTTGTQTTFLPEGELPECARLAYGAGREDMRPEEIADQELAEALQKSAEEAENSDEETTSLGTPSSPTSDGFKHPVRFPETGLKTSNPISRLLDRSVSAPSVCSREGSRAEIVHPRAAKSVDSLLERSLSLESREPPLSPRVISDHIASANFDASPAEKTGTELGPNPSIPSQNVFEKPVARVCLQKSNAKDDGLGMRLPAEAGGGSFSGACRLTKELGVPLLPKCVEQNRMHELQLALKPCKPGKEQLSLDGRNEANSSEDPCSSMAASALPANAEQSFDDFRSEGRATGEGRRPDCVPYKRPGGDTFMEVDVSKETLTAASEPSSSHNVGLTDAVNSECSTMEVQPSTCNSSLPVGRPSASDLMQPGSTTFQSAGLSAATGASAVSSGGQPSDRADDPCISLTSALKELHQLLVVSSKRDLRVSHQEDGHQSAAVPEDHATNIEISQEEHECTYRDGQGVRVSLPECMGAEASTGMPSLESGADSVEVRERHQLAVSCGQDALVVQESSDLSNSVFLSPSATSNPLQCGEPSEILSRHLSSAEVVRGDAMEQSQPLSSHVQGQVAPWSTRNSFAEETGLPDASNAEVQRPPDGGRAELPLPVGSPDPVAAPQRPVFPPAAVDQIVQAGFTPQEAAEALEHAGGNADLALLILLAKNIVVPT